MSYRLGWIRGAVASIVVVLLARDVGADGASEALSLPAPVVVENSHEIVFDQRSRAKPFA